MTGGAPAFRKGSERGRISGKFQDRTQGKETDMSEEEKTTEAAYKPTFAFKFDSFEMREAMNRLAKSRHRTLAGELNRLCEEELRKAAERGE